MAGWWSWWSFLKLKTKLETKHLPINAISTHLYLMKNAWKMHKIFNRAVTGKNVKNRSIWQFTSKFCLFWCIYWKKSSGTGNRNGNMILRQYQEEAYFDATFFVCHSDHQSFSSTSKYLIHIHKAAYSTHNRNITSH